MSAKGRRILGAVCLALLQPVALGQPRAFDGYVLDALDGDTLVVLRGTTRVNVRLAEIDAPELDQPWGEYARQALADKLRRSTVRVDQIGRDRDGRVLGWVYQGRRNINRELVAEGIAWAYRRHLTDLRLAELEAQAQARKLGLWSLPREDRVPPWEWRRGHRRAPAAGAPEVATGSRFSCGGKRLCEQMWSCAEASFYLRQCGVRSLDPDRDGIPCESLCRGP